jgi:hypothetical protein
MTLTVVVGDQRVTRRVSGLKIKASSPGGFESVEFSVARKLDRSLFDQFTDVLVYDAATGEQVGGGRLMDQGRNDDGTWSVSCIGEGFASTTDRTEPYILVDRSLDNWFQSFAPNTRFKVQSAQDGLQYGTADAGLAFTVDAGNWGQDRFIRATYPLLTRAGQRAGAMLMNFRAGFSDGNHRVQVLLSSSLANSTPLDAPYSTATGATAPVVGNHFPEDRSDVHIQVNRTNGNGAGGDAAWMLAYGIVVVAQRMDRNRAVITGGVYASGKVTLDQAFTDVIARFCPRLDLAAGTIDAGTYQYDQLAWFDGISPKAVLDDMLNLEPTFSWHVWGKGPNGWETELVQTPTEVRYEASTVDGFSAPSPSLEVYNSVDVRWRDVIGQVQVTTVTSPVPALDEAGITRSTTLDLADELGSAAQATARGLTFLGDHAVPPNAGTLTVARRIYDGRTGRWVHPWNIRPGSLIRVRGIQPTPDTLNTTSPDGVTIFRIVVATYDEDSRTAVLELDTYSLDQQQAIASLFKRSRKR